MLAKSENKSHMIIESDINDFINTSKKIVFGDNSVLERFNDVKFTICLFQLIFIIKMPLSMMLDQSYLMRLKKGSGVRPQAQTTKNKHNMSGPLHRRSQTCVRVSF